VQYAVVHRALHRKTGFECAVKCIRKSALTAEDLAALDVEVAAMRLLAGHPNFVQLYDFYDEPDYYYICLEMLTGGELFDRICEKEKYTEREARDLLRQLTMGIAFAHSKGTAPAAAPSRCPAPCPAACQ
jgi:serine/threonine protein kinase